MARSGPKIDGVRNDALHKYLDQLGWSKRGFALRVHNRCRAVGLPNTVSPSTVGRWCSGETIPSAALAAAACRVLASALRQRVTPESLGWPADTTDIAAESLEYRDLDHAVRMLSKLWELRRVWTRITRGARHGARLRGLGARHVQGHGHRH